MKANLWPAFFVGSVVLSMVSAVKISEVAQRRGFTKAMVKDLQDKQLNARAANTTDLRFYTNDTARMSLTTSS